MPIKEKRVRVTLEQNPNLKTTVKTREHIGVQGVGGEEDVQARLLGVPGPQGDVGDQGPIGPVGPAGPVGMVWMGEWSVSATYQKGNAVSYFGSSYIYINDLPSTGQPVDNNPMYWDVLALAGEQGPPGSSSDDSAEVMAEPTGFPNLTDSTIYVNNTQRRVYIQPSVGGGTFDYWISGQKITKSAPESVQIPDVESVYYIYYDTDNILKMSTVFPVPLKEKVTVALVYWDVDDQAFTFFGEERHGLTMDWATHAYLHETQGCQYGYGLDLFYTDDGDGSTDTELRIGISDGTIHDEDLRHSIEHHGTPVDFFNQVLYPEARLPVMYREGASGNWNKYAASIYPVRFGTNYCLYNEFSGGVWQESEVGNNVYFCMWIYATNNVHEPIMSFMGQDIDSNLENALEKNSLENLDLGVLPSPEFKLLYRITYQSRNQFSNSFNAKVIRVDDYRAFTDKYGVGSPIGGSPSPVFGDKHYTHNQSTADSVWTIVHGMNKVPSVEVIDSGGTVVEGDIEVIDINTIRLTFSSPFTGKAYLN